jgi:hypothetical protein
MCSLFQMGGPEKVGIQLVNQTPGREQDTDFYRAEVKVIYGCITFTNTLLSEQIITQGQVTMACDCISALRNIFTHDFDQPSQPHYDLIHAYRLLAQESPLTWKERHVYGYQDDKKPYHLLDRIGTTKHGDGHVSENKMGNNTTTTQTIL